MAYVIRVSAGPNMQEQVPLLEERFATEEAALARLDALMDAEQDAAMESILSGLVGRVLLRDLSAVDFLYSDEYAPGCYTIQTIRPSRVQKLRAAGRYIDVPFDELHPDRIWLAICREEPDPT